MKIKEGYEIQTVVDDEGFAKEIAKQIRTQRYYAYVQSVTGMCKDKFTKVFVVFKKQKEMRK